jgi:alpha-D-ribose 1-methylphosphonate 5-triphosphate diphosphatase
MWLSDFQIVLPDGVLQRGSLRIEHGCIAEIVEGPVRDAAVQGAGLLAIPGLIDMHGDMLERDISPRPGAELPFAMALYELDKRLVATGITTAYAAVSFAWHTGPSWRRLMSCGPICWPITMSMLGLRSPTQRPAPSWKR